MLCSAVARAVAALWVAAPPSFLAAVVAALAQAAASVVAADLAQVAAVTLAAAGLLVAGKLAPTLPQSIALQWHSQVKA